MLVALYLQQALTMAPQQAGLAMVPTSLTGFVFSLALLPRIVRVLGPQRSLVAGLVILAAGHLWLANAPTAGGYLVAVLPGLLLVAVGVALSFTPTTMVIASAQCPRRTPASRPGWPGQRPRSAPPSAPPPSPPSASPSAVPVAHTLGASGFSAAFTAAAAVALATAALGTTIARARH